MTTEDRSELVSEEEAPVEQDLAPRKDGGNGARSPATSRLILHGQRQIVEILAGSDGLESMLGEVCKLFEEAVEGATCAIMLHDQSNHELRVGAAPNLPDDFVSEIDGIEVDAKGASCGAAIHHGKTVVVEDIKDNPIWQVHGEAAIANGLRSAWSIPLRLPARGERTDRRLVGTLDFYFDRIERYTEDRLETMESACDLAGFVVQCAQENAAGEGSNLDLLTSLPNRRAFNGMLRQLVDEERAKDASDRGRFAVVALDLDNFKDVNDTLGYKMGDLLLRALGQRLAGCLRDNDSVARSGGDDLILLIRDLKRDDDINFVAEKILKRVNDPYDFSGHGLFVTASMGISVYPWDGEDAQTLLRNAETALVSAKERGGSNFQFFRPTMARHKPTFDSWMEQAKLGSQLRDVLKHKQLELYYQLKYGADRQTIFGAEALMRWNHPELGLVSPMRFIPMAEQMGLITSFGQWALRQACTQNKQWQDAGLLNIPISVNVSPHQFRQGRLVEDIRTILDETRLDPGHLELEIVERLAMEDTSTNLHRLQSLANLGLQLSIDDFGTGFSSLSYLSKFPFHTIKIDRSFIKDIGTGNDQDADSQSIVLAIISMAQNLSLKTVAEGAETEEQVDFLFEHKCDVIQGFFFSKPTPAPELTKTLIARS